MKIIKSTVLSELQKDSIYNLWNDEYPQNLQYSNISEFDGYLNGLTDLRHYFLVDELNTIAAWAAIFTRSNEKWFAIIVNSLLHGKGVW